MRHPGACPQRHQATNESARADHSGGRTLKGQMPSDSEDIVRNCGNGQVRSIHDNPVAPAEINKHPVCGLAHMISDEAGRVGVQQAIIDQQPVKTPLIPVDRVRAVTVCKDEHIRTGTAVQGVIAISAVQRVVASAPDKPVVSAFAPQPVIARTTLQQVRTTAAQYGVEARSAFQRVVAGSTAQLITPLTTKQRVVAIAALQRVVTCPANKGIEAVAADDPIMAGTPFQRIVPPLPAIQSLPAPPNATSCLDVRR